MLDLSDQLILESFANVPEEVKLAEIRKDEKDESQPNTHTEKIIQTCEVVEKEIEYLLLTAEPINSTVNLIGKHTIKLNILIERIDSKSKLYKFLVNKWRLFI